MFPSTGRADGRTFFVKFYVFFENLTKLLIPSILPRGVTKFLEIYQFWHNLANSRSPIWFVDRCSTWYFDNGKENMCVSGYMYMYIFTTDPNHRFYPPNGKWSKMSKFVKICKKMGPHSFFWGFWGGVKMVIFGVPTPPGRVGKTPKLAKIVKIHQNWAMGPPKSSKIPPPPHFGDFASI